MTQAPTFIRRTRFQRSLLPLSFGALLLLAVGAYALRPRALRRYRRRREGWRRRRRRACPQTRRAPAPARLAEPLEPPVTVSRSRAPTTRSVPTGSSCAPTSTAWWTRRSTRAARRPSDTGLALRDGRLGRSRDRPALTYSAEALDGFLGEVADEINRPARDAIGQPRACSLTRCPARTGSRSGSTSCGPACGRRSRARATARCRSRSIGSSRR